MEYSKEEVYKNWMRFLATMVTKMYNLGEEMAGEAYVQKLEEKFFEEGARQTKEILSSQDIRGRDCMAIGKIGDEMDARFGMTWEGYDEQSPTAYKKQITSCPMGEFFSEAPDICLRLVPALARGLLSCINPDVTYRIEGCKAKGDKTCGTQFEIKKQSYD